MSLTDEEKLAIGQQKYREVESQIQELHSKLTRLYIDEILPAFIAIENKKMEAWKQ